MIHSLLIVTTIRAKNIRHVEVCACLVYHRHQLRAAIRKRGITGNDGTLFHRPLLLQLK